MKNQKRPPHGKPHSIIRVAGGIMGEKSFAYPVPLSRGLFRVEMVYEFAVIVAVASFLQENTEKYIKTTQNGGNTHQFLHYYKKRAKTQKSATILQDLTKSHNEIRHFMQKSCVLLVKSEKMTENVGKYLQIYIYIYRIQCMKVGLSPQPSYIFLFYGGITNACYSGYRQENHYPALELP